MLGSNNSSSTITKDCGPRGVPGPSWNNIAQSRINLASPHWEYQKNRTGQQYSPQSHSLRSMRHSARQHGECVQGRGVIHTHTHPQSFFCLSPLILTPSMVPAHNRAKKVSEEGQSEEEDNIFIFRF